MVIFEKEVAFGPADVLSIIGTTTETHEGKDALYKVELGEDGYMTSVGYIDPERGVTPSPVINNIIQNSLLEGDRYKGHSTVFIFINR